MEDNKLPKILASFEVTSRNAKLQSGEAKLKQRELQLNQKNEEIHKKSSELDVIRENLEAQLDIVEKKKFQALARILPWH